MPTPETFTSPMAARAEALARRALAEAGALEAAARAEAWLAVARGLAPPGPEGIAVRALVEQIVWLAVALRAGAGLRGDDLAALHFAPAAVRAAVALAAAPGDAEALAAQGGPLAAAVRAAELVAHAGGENGLGWGAVEGLLDAAGAVGEPLRAVLAERSSSASNR